MTAGLDARLERIDTGGMFLIIPIDHGITLGIIKGLSDIESTIDAVTSGGADSIITQTGIAPRVHNNKNSAG